MTAHTQSTIQKFRPSVIVALVSNQPASNITPVLDPDFKPEKVILVQSQQFNNQADWLEEVLIPTGIKISRCLIDNDHDIEQIRNHILNLLIAHEGESIALNISGGSKVMSVAAYEVFRSADKPVFYVHAESDELIWMFPHHRPPHPLADKLKLKAFIGAHGAAIEQMNTTAIANNQRVLTHELVTSVEALQGPLRALNWYAHQARKLQSPPLQQRHLSHGSDFAALATRFEQQGFLTRNNGRLNFSDEESRFYVNGGWLEEHVYSVLFGLRQQVPAIQDIGRSVEIVRLLKSDPVRNELDVAFLANNKLYIIECKTRHFPKNDDGKNPLGAETIYKLDTLKELLGGLYGKAMLVSYGQFSRYDRQRATDLGIETCVGNEIQSLAQKLSNWIS